MFDFGIEFVQLIATVMFTPHRRWRLRMRDWPETLDYEA